MARYNVSLDILSLTESPALLRQKNMRNHKWRLVVVADPAESHPGRQSRRFLMSGRQSHPPALSF